MIRIQNDLYLDKFVQKYELNDNFNVKIIFKLKSHRS